MKKKTTAIILVLGIITGMFIAGVSRKSNAIYSIDGQKVSADEYFETLSEQYGTNFTYQFLEKTYLSAQDVEEDITESLKKSEEQLKEEAKDEEQRKMLEATLRSFGYKGLDELNLYLKNSYVRNKIVEDNFVDYFKDEDAFLEEYKPRLVTHVLIRVEDKDVKLTDEIQKQMDQIDKALKNVDNMKISMIELNDGGSIIAEDLGYVDKESPLAPEFLEESLRLNFDETSDWLKTDFGFHRIYVENTDPADLLKRPEVMEKVLQSNPNLNVEIMLDKMLEDGMSISDSLLKEIKEMAGL